MNMATVQEELLAIKGEEQMLAPDKVVEWAEANPASALHSKFEWDDVIAAKEHRLNQARALIRLHVVLDDGSPRLVSLSFDRARGGGYRDMSDVLASRDLTSILLRDALAELERVKRRYARVSALAKVWSEIEAIERPEAGEERAESPSAA